VKIGFETAVQHAICAEFFLSKLILSKTPTLNRIRIFLHKTKKEHNCRDFLRKGTLNKKHTAASTKRG
jgi:hypothetical protein